MNTHIFIWNTNFLQIYICRMQIYNCRMQFAIFNLIKLQTAAEPTPSTCCSLHLLDIWFFRKSLRNLILSHPTWFLPHSTIMWLQRDQFIQHREAAEACRGSWLTAEICKVQPKSVCSALDLLHKKHLFWTKQLKQASLASQIPLSNVSFVPTCKHAPLCCSDAFERFRFLLPDAWSR